MKITSYADLPLEKEVWLGNANICNRYLRHDDVIEVQRIVRYGRNGETQMMTNVQFDEWLAEIERMKQSE